MCDIFPGARSSRDRVRAIGSNRTIAAACCPSIPRLEAHGSVHSDAVRPVEGVDQRADPQIAVRQGGVRPHRCVAPRVEGGEHGALRRDLDPGLQIVQSSERFEQVGCGVGPRLDGERTLSRRGRPLVEAQGLGDESAQVSAESRQTGGGEHHRVEIAVAHARQPRVDVAAQVAHLHAVVASQHLRDAAG